MRCPGLEVEKVLLQCPAIIEADNLVAAAMNSRFSRTGPATQKSLSGCGRNSGGSFFGLVCFVLFLIWGLLTLLWEKRQGLSKHCHQHCYWELEDLSFSSDLQCKLTTLHPKWITVLDIFQNALFHHFCTFVHFSSLHWKCPSLFVYLSKFCHFLSIQARSPPHKSLTLASFSITYYIFHLSLYAKSCSYLHAFVLFLNSKFFAPTYHYLWWSIYYKGRI